MDNKMKDKEYNLLVPKELDGELKRLSIKENTSVLVVIRKALKLLLALYTLQEQGAKLIIQQDEEERELTLF